MSTATMMTAGTLKIVRRLPVSRNGNPRYLATVNSTEYRTETDSMLAYELPNFDGKYVAAKYRTLRGHLTLCEVIPLTADAL